MGNLPIKNKISSWADTNFFVVVVVAVVVFSATLYLLAGKVDELAIQREQSQLQNSLKDTVTDLAAVVLPNIDWDEAVLNLDNHYSPEWADTNTGHFFCTSQGFKYVFILDRNDQVIYSMQDNQHSSLASFAPFQAAAVPILASIRKRENQRGNVFKPLQQGGLVSVPVQGSDIVRSGDDLVIATFTLVQPDYGTYLPAGPRSVVVMTGKVINAHLLKHLSDRLMLANLHLVQPNEKAGTRVSLTNQAGAKLGQLAWTPYQPAAYLIEIAMLPILLGVGTPLVLYFYSRRTSRLLRSTLTELSASDERWSFALEGSGEGVWDWDLVSNKVQLSRQWKTMLGFAEYEIGDEFDDWLAHIHPEDMAAVMSAVEENRDGNNHSFSIEHRVICKDGSELWVLNRGMAVNRDVHGRAQRMVGTFSDISRHKQMEMMKSQFISSVSHELRTPVTSIRGSLGLLESGVLGQLPPKAHDMVVIAHRNSLRLLNLVNDILNMDKLISGKMVFRSDPVDLVDMALQSIESNAAYGDSYQVKFVLAEKIADCTVRGDVDRIMQVMANLLSNAAKFSSPGGVVNIRITDSGEHVKIEVQDGGQGIPVDFQSQIFSPFSQASNGDTRRQGGTGLGLHISKKLIENMQGSIGFSSTPGAGSIFWFSLPRCFPD